MSNKSLFALIGGVLLAIVAWNSIYIVYQTEKAVLLQFGELLAVRGDRLAERWPVYAD